MSINLVHLSDMHLTREEGKANYLPSLPENMAETILHNCPQASSLSVLITGDITFSGSASDFELANDFVNSLKSRLLKEYDTVDFICVPGNHDCDFSTDQTVRDTLIGSVTLDKIKNSSFTDQILKVQQNYLDFVKQLRAISPIGLLEYQEKTYIDFNIGFLLLNSSWMSIKEEKPGSLVFPPEFINLEVGKNTDLVICLMHHPNYWFNEDIKRELQRKIEEYSTLVLTGHEHEGDYYEIKKPLLTDTRYLEGLVLQDSKILSDRKKWKSEFRIINLSHSNQGEREIDIEIREFLWAQNGYIGQNDKLIKDKMPYPQRRKRVSSPSFSDKAIHFLTDPGMSIINRYKTNLRISDIFVYPDLKYAEYYLNSKRRKIERPIIDFFRDNDRIHISGREKAGKTSLAKKICQDLLDLQFIPIYLSGSEIKRTSWEEFENCYLRKIDEFYYKEQLDLQDYNRRVLIIDDFQDIRGNNKEKIKFLGRIDHYFKKIVIFTSSDWDILGLVTDIDNQEVIKKYTKVQIMPFGESRTFELVEKWVHLGRETTIEESEANKQVVTAKRAIEKTIGRGYMPSTPLFLLFILMKNDNPIEFHGKITGNSVASIYEAIITFSLANIQSDAMNVNLEKIQHFLSDLAYHFYTSGQSQISEYELSRWFAKRNETKGIALNFDQTIKITIQADLLAYTDGFYSFKYDYATFFYLADYFRSIEFKDKFIDEIDAVFNKIPNIFELNLIKFITYRCSHPYIASLLLDKSRVLFEKVDPVVLPDHLNFLSVSGEKSTAKVIKPRNYNSLRKASLELSDKLSEEFSLDNTDSGELVDNTNSMSLQSEGTIRDLYGSIQILDLIGQVLVNMGNSLEFEQRNELFFQAIQLARRQLRYISGFMESNRSVIISLMVSWLEDVNPEALSRLGEDGVFCEMVTSFVTASLGRYAEALTSDEISIYVNKLRQEENNQFVLLIKLISSMFFSGNCFPYDDLENIRKVNKEMNLTMSIVINLLMAYFITFNTSESEQKRIINSIKYYRKH